MADLQFMGPLAAFRTLGAKKSDGSEYGAVRGISVSADEQCFRFWENDVHQRDDGSIELVRSATDHWWIRTGQGKKFYAALERALAEKKPVFAAINKRGGDDSKGNWTCKAAAPLQNGDGSPAAGEVLHVNPSTGEVRVRFEFSPKKRFVDQFAFREVPVNEDLATSIRRSRDREIRLRVLEDSMGLCEACGEEAFETPNGVYMETHHIVPLSAGGADSTVNVVALCPTCHRKAHFSLQKDALKRTLLAIAKDRRGRGK